MQIHKGSSCSQAKTNLHSVSILAPRSARQQGAAFRRRKQGSEFVSTVQPAPVEQSVGSLRPTNALGSKKHKFHPPKVFQGQDGVHDGPVVPVMSLMILVGIQAIRKPSSMGHPFNPTAITKLLHSTCIHRIGLGMQRCEYQPPMV